MGQGLHGVQARGVSLRSQWIEVEARCPNRVTMIRWKSLGLAFTVGEDRRVRKSTKVADQGNVRVEPL